MPEHCCCTCAPQAVQACQTDFGQLGQTCDAIPQTNHDVQVAGVVFKDMGAPLLFVFRHSCKARLLAGSVLRCPCRQAPEAWDLRTAQGFCLPQRLLMLPCKHKLGDAGPDAPA